MNVELDELKRDIASRQAPPRVEEALMAAFRARPRGRLMRVRPVWAAVAAAIICAAVILWRPAKVEDKDAADRVVATDFFPLQRGWTQTDEPHQLIRIRLPRSEMRRFGLPVSFESDQTNVHADVLLGPDGVARAVRFVR